MSSKLLDTVASSLEPLDPRDCRRAADLPVWSLKYPGLFASRTRRRAVEECKECLLHVLADSPPAAFLFHPDDPSDYDAKGPWTSGTCQTTRMSGELHLEHSGTRDWLALGNWEAYVASNPLGEGWIDPARTPPSQLLGWMAHVEMAALIDSFHDDISWVIAINPTLAA